MRFIGGFSAGAVFPLLTLMFFHRPGQHRGISFICNVILTASYLLPTLCGSWAINGAAGRRGACCSSCGSIVTIYFAPLAPQSPRWLMRRTPRRSAPTRGTPRKSAGIEHDDTFINPDVLRSLEQAATERTRTGASWKALFRAPTSPAPRFVEHVLAAGLITWYVVMVCVPTILTTTGSSFPTQSS